MKIKEIIMELEYLMRNEIRSQRELCGYHGFLAQLSPIRRPNRNKAHRRPKYPHRNTDLDHDLKSGLWAIRLQLRPLGFIAQARLLLASCRF